MILQPHYCAKYKSSVVILGIWNEWLDTFNGNLEGFQIINWFNLCYYRINNSRVFITKQFIECGIFCSKNVPSKIIQGK